MHESPIARFVRELKRRRVFRVAAGYLVVAWVVMQVANVVAPALGLPPWTTPLVVVLALLGLPIAIVLAWALELTPDGVRRTVPADAEARPAAAGMSRRTLALAAVVLLAIAGGAWWAGRPPAPPEPGANAVAVLPFSFHGRADLAYLGVGMSDLLGASLNGAAELRAVDAHAVARLAGDGGAAAPDRERGQALARRLGAGLYVVGGITEVGGRLRAQARLLSVGGAVVATAEAGADSEADVFEMVDELARHLLAGRSRGAADQFVRLAARTTHSMPALKAYLEGERVFRSGDWRGSVEHLQRAVELDSSFALAHYRRALAESWLYDRVAAKAASDRALQHAARLPEHEQLLVQALHAYMYGRADEAERLYRTIVQRTPDNAEAWYQLGETLIHYNPLRGRPSAESRHAFERAAELVPAQTESLLHLVQLATAERRFGELAPLLDELLRRELNEPMRFQAVRAFALGDEAEQAELLARYAASTANEELGGTFWELANVLQDLTAAERLVDALQAAPRTPAQRAMANFLRYDVASARGQWRDAASALEAAMSDGPAAPPPVFAILEQLGSALRPFHEPDPARLRTLRDELASAPLPTQAPLNEYTAMLRPGRAYLLGLASARLGEHDVARRYAAEVAASSTGVPDADALAAALAHAVHAEIAFVRGELHDALRHIESAYSEVPSTLTTNHPGYAANRERFIRAELLGSLGREQEAAAWYASVIDRSTWGLPYLAPVHLRLGSIRENAGDHAEAAFHYARVLELWAHADAELQPIVAQARRRLEALLAEAGTAGT
jgi:tetratricopeptide (TPR) repeat protein